MTTNGRAPSTAADALASADSACTLACSRLRSRSTPDRLPSASDRLPPACCWMAMTMAKKRTSGSGMRTIMRSKHSASGTPTRCCSTSSVNSPAIGCGDFARDDAEALVQRQARLDAAHDHVDGVGELVGELVLAPLRQAGEHPARQAEAPDEHAEQRHDDRQVGREHHDAARRRAARMMALAIQNVRGGMSRPARSRRSRSETFSRCFCRSSSSFSVSATWRRRLLVDLRLLLAGDAPALALGRSLDALVGAMLAGQVGRQQQVDDRAHRDGGERDQAGEHQVVAIHGPLPSAGRAGRAPRRPTGPRPGAWSRRSTRRAPRSAGGRCRSSDGGR